MRQLKRFIAAAALLAGATCGRMQTGGGAPDAGWAAAWEAPPQRVEPNNMPPAPGLDGRTIRQMIHVSLGGSRWRFRLSNEFGDGPLVIRAAHVALSRGGGRIDPASDAPLAFDGRASTTIDAGRAVVSDAVAFPASRFADVAITLLVERAPRGLTGHPGSRTTSFIAAGDATRDSVLAAAAETAHWYVISGAEVASPSDGAVVVLGNSIADGRGSGTDRNDRWPDNLARRFAESGSTIAVLNAGIGGNAVLRGGLGPTAQARFDRDVLAQRGVKWLIVSEGVNDIGGARGADSSASVARQLIAAFGGLIARAHARGIRVYGATILPFTGSQYTSPDHEAARAAVNAWIRTSGAFDAVIDLDAAMRDPAQPTRLRPDVDSGDHLHPNEIGYRVMADAIDLRLFGR